MTFVYLLLNDGCDWDDMVLFLTEPDAITASIEHPHWRIEIFSKNNTVGYLPTYNYYKNGQLYNGNI